jgi:hypothetical protein
MKTDVIQKTFYKDEIQNILKGKSQLEERDQRLILSNEIKRLKVELDRDMRY